MQTKNVCLYAVLSVFVTSCVTLLVGTLSFHLTKDPEIVLFRSVVAALWCIFLFMVIGALACCLAARHHLRAKLDLDV